MGPVGDAPSEVEAVEDAPSEVVVGDTPSEVALEEGVALGEVEGGEVGTSPVAEESLIHGEWGSVLACVNIYAILIAIEKMESWCTRLFAHEPNNTR